MIWGKELFFVSLTLTYFPIILANQEHLIQVIGLLQHSVELLSNVSFSSSVQEADWYFKDKVKIAQFENHQPKFYKNHFEGRLELHHNGTILCIKDLRMEDSGKYTVHFIVSDTNYVKEFILMVYEPVPVPSIKIILEEQTSHWCNMSLNCFVPSNSSTFNYSWTYKHIKSVQELRTIGDAIHISLNYSWGMEFQCIVGNPADQKNVSKQARCYVTGLLKLTKDDDQTQATTNNSQRHILSAEVKEDGEEHLEQDLVYCETTISTVTPPSTEIQNFSWHKRDNHHVNPPPQKFKTLYTSLQRK
ncbi:CD48 antigen isoform X2 [Pyxicephalus adspersus]|uniref:CD48 antigen isoform X2 n=1 Tax=Pyxicephalus adspersus TaxID=30357 RepID=UPI003B5A0B56